MEQSDPKNQKTTPPAGEPQISQDGVWDVLGWSYDVLGAYADPESVKRQVVDAAAYYAADPSRVLSEGITSETFVENAGSDALSWSTKKSASVKATFGLNVFKKLLSADLSGSYTTSNKFDGKWVYANYDMLVKLKRLRFLADPVDLRNYLAPSFIADLNTYGNNPQQLVARYGTHVCNNIYVGQRLDMQFRSESKSENREQTASADVQVGVKNVFSVQGTGSVNSTFSTTSYNRTLTYKARGGSGAGTLVGTINLDQPTTSISLTSWRNSLNASNALLVDFYKDDNGVKDGLVPQYELIPDATMRANVKTYIDQYLVDNQI